MGFIDYVAEYFRGPAGEPGPAGDPGPAGPALEVVQQATAFADGSGTGDPSTVTLAPPTGKAIAGVAVLNPGDKPPYFYSDNAGFFEYGWPGSSTVQPTATLQLLVFYRPA